MSKGKNGKAQSVTYSAITRNNEDTDFGMYQLIESRDIPQYSTENLRNILSNSIF